jgi:SulP family sulfate permease
MITAALVALTAITLTPLFHQLPNAALAAIIFAAVLTLFDFKTPRFVYRYSRADGAALAGAFFAVLFFGVANGILVGAGLSLLLYIARTSRPHVAVVGRMGESEHYRNVLRHEVTTWPTVVLVRVDESLYFANVGVLADVIMAQAADHPDAREIVLICAAINSIDASALETLRTLVDDLRRVGVDLHLTDVKGPVMDKLEAIGFVAQIGRDHIHLSAHAAMQHLGYVEDGVKGCVELKIDD